ncbi:MAG: selenoneine biosynthesis selenosugar synthase SenB [Comamonadaceae bacterium]|nr:TIGR04348 family glycosyltransferase [Burkholderiales bacterium]MEB2348092.1 selenoneine biosynthesis selenosugar synthase SenB [Comamonadaceae bacterium]
MPGLPLIEIVTPTPEANNGNGHTARRWARCIAQDARVRVEPAWSGAPVDALIALHAYKSAPSIARFRAAFPERPIALVLTGTDLYRDLAREPRAQAALASASHWVVLQQEAVARLPAWGRERVWVIEQSATRLVRAERTRRWFDFIAVGHLRDVKDPQVLMRAARLLPALWTHALAPRVLHVGAALQPRWADAATRAMAEMPHYRWLGALPQGTTRQRLARSRALVHMSRMEGGAHVVIEALRSRVPVLASRIDGNVGLLGRDYDGLFPVGDAAALARLMCRYATDTAFAAHLAAQCAAREARFAPKVEAARVRALVAQLLADRR